MFQTCMELLFQEYSFKVQGFVRFWSFLNNTKMSPSISLRIRGADIVVGGLSIELPGRLWWVIIVVKGAYWATSLAETREF